MKLMNDRLPWSSEIWERIHHAVSHETKRVEVAPKFLPLFEAMPETLTITSDTILTDEEAFLYIDEAAIYPLIELWVEFSLTPQQVEKEMDIHTAWTLAIRATNFLSRAEDVLIFQGQTAALSDPLFSGGRVGYRSGPAGTGLLNAPLREDQTVTVRSLVPGVPIFRERTLSGVTEGCARLKKTGHYGPYALILHDIPYGDTFSPLSGTLIKAAERLRPMCKAGFYGTGTLPANPSPTGLLIDLGGNSMDLVHGKPAHPEFLFDDAEGLYRFRVSKRFALRLKDPSAIIKLIFETEGAGQ
ncbi:MAG: hypothetical protein ETSY1_13070 [Candidatus Entotheonella factor]|uniref:Bacteriocin n=1 Tax=Entotheonella factor TaxID=1429438 RepID=W4LRD5_ENTF1|nr:MAG: hypothetical protein ETSY1_13070 [Candidatus Entotheonella factor]